MSLSEFIKKYPEDFKPVYTGELLYIVRNHGNSHDRHNRSILGVFTTPQMAQKAILKQKEKWNDETNAQLEVKVVIPNTSAYLGCSAYHINDLIEDPKAFEIAVRAWSTWNYILIEGKI